MTNFSKNILSVAVVLTLLLLLGGGAFLAYMQFNSQVIVPPSNIPISNNQVVNNIVNNDARQGTGLPAHLSIPSINVNANIIYVGLAADGSVGTPDGPHEVAWYQLGPRPGDTGSAVLTGHFGPWKTGAKSVFDNLHTLKTGDKIYVTDDKGKESVFIVRESRMYNANEIAPEIFNTTDGKHLNLITCSGDWQKNQQTYTQRLVVFTDAVPE